MIDTTGMMLINTYILKDRILSVAVVIIPMFISDIFLGFHSYQFIIYVTLITITLVSPMKKNYSLDNFFC